jgi:hypothetical protein
MLQEAAAEAGRSVSEEIEYRLERSFFDDRNERRYLGSDVGSEIIRLIRLAMAIEGVSGKEWSEDQRSAENVRVAANLIIAAIANLPVDLPAPEARVAGMQTAAALLAKSSVRSRLRSSFWSLVNDLRAT